MKTTIPVLKPIARCSISVPVPFTYRSIHPIGIHIFYLVSFVISIMGMLSAKSHTTPLIVNRPTRSGQHHLVYEIAEESKRGTTVGNIITDLFQLISPNEKSHQPKVDLTITNWRDQEAKYFSLDPHTGHLRVILPPDRELLCPGLADLNSNQMANEDYVKQTEFDTNLHPNLNYSNGEVRGSQNSDTQCQVTLQIAYNIRNSDRQEKSDSMQLQTTNQDPGLILVKIRILDINDHSPRFPQSRLDVELGEISSVAGKSVIDLPIAFDPDAGANGSLIYWLGQNEESTKSTNKFSSSPNSIPFRLEGEPLRLVLTDTLDWERQRDYNLIVFVKDMGIPMSRTGQIDVHVTVRDENDNIPQFSQPVYSVAINESTLRGTVILELQATDEDSASNGQLTFSLAPPVNSMERAALQYFGIRTVSSHKAVIFVLQTPDVDGKKRTSHTDLRLNNAMTSYTDQFEPNNLEFVFHAIVRDNGYPRQLSSRAQIKIRVMDVNDMAPTILISYLHTTPNERNQNMIHSNQGNLMLVADHNHGQISENMNRGFIGFVTVQDLDSSVWGQVNCQTDNDAFELIPVTDTDALNRVSAHYASQSTSPTLVTSGNYGFKLFSTKPFDREQTSEVSFRILCVDNPQYYLTPTLDANQNYYNSLPKFGQEFQQSFDTSNKIVSNIQLTGTALVRVFIADENDNIPVFLRNEYMFTVEETDRQSSDGTGFLNANKESRTIVGKVTATDQDSTSVLTYYLQGDSMNSFSIDKTNGNIYAIREFDRENLLSKPSNLQTLEPGALIVEITSDNSVYLNFPVYVTDGHHNATSKIKVLIRDINDNAPIFEKSHYEFHIVENEQLPKGGSIGQVQATDTDYGINANIVYHILDIDSSDEFGTNHSVKKPNSLMNRASRTYFTVSMTSGQLHLIRKLDREQQTHHVFYVIAMDNPHEQYKQDAWQKLDTTQHGLSKFRSTGKSFTATATVTIIVLDVNDNAPTITYPIPHGIINVEAGAPAGHNLFTVLAHDPDAGENGTVRYTLNTASFETVHNFGDVNRKMSNNLNSLNESDSNHTNRVTNVGQIKPSGLFTIDETTGIVFVTEKLSDRSANYLVMIGAHDLGQPTQRKSTITVTIRVQNTKLLHVLNSFPLDESDSDSLVRNSFHQDAQNSKSDPTNNDKRSPISHKRRSDKEPMYNFHSYTNKIDQPDSTDTRRSGNSSNRFRLISLSDRTVVIILAIVFTLLLITTVVLIFLIKKRRDAENRRIQSDKSNYRGSLNIKLSSKMLPQSHLQSGPELITCSNSKLNEISSIHVVHPMTQQQQQQQQDDVIDHNDLNSSTDYGPTGYPRFYGPTTNEFEPNHHPTTSLSTSNNYQHFYAPTLLGPSSCSLRKTTRPGSDSPNLLEGHVFQKNTKDNRPEQTKFNTRYQTIGSILVSQDEQSQKIWSRTLQEHGHSSPKFCTITTGRTGGNAFNHYGPDANTYAVLGPTTDVCFDQQSGLDQFRFSSENNQSKSKSVTLPSLCPSPVFNDRSVLTIQTSTNNTRNMNTASFDFNLNNHDPTEDVSAKKIGTDSVKSSNSGFQNSNIIFQPNQTHSDKMKNSSSGPSKHTTQNRGVTFV